MMRNRCYRTTLAATVFAAALGAIACEGNRAGDDARDTVGTSGQQDSKSVTLSGCLQRGDGDEYLLSQASEAPRAVGTSGSSDNTGGVESKQLAEASRTYRLSGDDDQLRGLVGQRVRVSGTLEDRGDLAEDKDNANRDQREKDEDRPEIKEGDLARVEVASIESVAKTCGTAAQK